MDESYFNLSVNGQKLDLDYRTDFVYGTETNKRSAFEDSGLVFVGYGVNAPEYEWNDYKVDVKDKTVVMLINDPGFELKGTEFNGKATYFTMADGLINMKKKEDMAAVLIIHETAPASYGEMMMLSKVLVWRTIKSTFADQNLDRSP